MMVDQKWVQQRAAEIAIIQQQNATEAARRASEAASHDEFLARVTAYQEGRLQVQFDATTAPRLSGIFTALDAQHMEAQAQRRREQAALHASNPGYYLAGMPLPPHSPFLRQAKEAIINKKDEGK